MTNHETPRVDTDAETYPKSDERMPARQSEKPAPPREPASPGGQILEAALRFAAQGIPVFPCDPDPRKGRGKRPLVPGESTPGAKDGGLYQATTDPTQIRDWWERWPNALIGVPCGQRSGVTVIDLDPGSASAESMLEALAQTYGIENTDPRTGEVLSPAMVRTQGSGLHLWYRAEPEDRNRADIFRGGRAAPPVLREGGKVDIRGAGGYAIAPPSRMADVKTYAWEGPGIEKLSALPVMPPKLREAMFGRPERGRSPHGPAAPAPQYSDAAARKYALAALDGEARRLASVRSGGRNSALNVAATKLSGYGASGLLSDAMIQSALEEACATNGLTKDDGIASVRATIASGMAAGRLTPKVPPEPTNSKSASRSRKSKPKAHAGKAAAAADQPPADADDPDEADSDSGGRKAPRQSDRLLAAADEAQFWHSPTKVPHATFVINGHYENWPIESEVFKRWVAGRYYRATGGAVAGATLADAMRIFAVRAVEEGPCHKPLLRTGWDGKHCWLDLCDDGWRAVKIAPHGWEIVDTPPVKFVRSETMTALPAPEAGVMIEELRSFINCSDDDFILVVAWLIAALWGRARTYPILALGGEQGSGKSTTARLLRELVDPSAVSGLALPKDDRDLVAQSSTSLILAYDNISRIENWFSDAVCRLATGAGFLTRRLHSDAAPFWFSGSRPVALNGIPSLTERGDLAERALTIRLLRIDETARQSEDEWWQSWEAIRPGILGALLDALSAALRNYDSVKLEKMPRMADLAKLMAAAEPGLGLEPGEFTTAYEANRGATSEDIFESNAVAVAVVKMMEDRPTREPWEGTTTSLLARLNTEVGDEIRQSRFWPSQPSAFGTAIRRAAPTLRHKKIAFDEARRLSNKRQIVLSWIEPG